MMICAVEDRSNATVGVKLLVLSVSRTSPGLSIDVTVSKEMEPGLVAWAKGLGLDNVRFRTEKSWTGSGWNVKPGKLLEQLDEGQTEVVWIDTDIIANRDLRPMLAGLSDDTVALGQEFQGRHENGGRMRAERWGLKYGRHLPYSMNGGFLRFTHKHRAYLEKYRELLSRPEYLHSQSIPIPERQIHMVSDQDVIWALLASEEFSHHPVHYLRCGDEIIQNSGANGYNVKERLRNTVRGLPPLIHALGKEKPWHFPEVPQGKRDKMELTVLELSPYVTVARRYARELGEDAPWLNVRTGVGRALQAMTLGHHSLQGLPPAILADVLRRLGRKPG
jgi:hypothetical protein